MWDRARRNNARMPALSEGAPILLTCGMTHLRTAFDDPAAAMSARAWRFLHLCPAASAPRSLRQPMPAKRIVPLIVAVALFMENMDSTVIATSLPAIAADIGTSPLTLKLAVTSYLLSLAVFIPVSGWTADRFGARTV